MKRGLLALAAIAVLATVMHAARPYTMRAWFPDGTGLEIFTETSGASELEVQSGLGIGPGVTHDLVNRVVVDRNNNILFAYNIEASRGARPDTVLIRIEPISAATEAAMLKRDLGPKTPKFAGTHLPTVATIREFPAVRIGEVVTLDILYNPSTGEKIFDVFRPVTDAPPSSGRMLVSSSKPARETISFKDVSIRLNGKPVSAPASWMIGAAVRIDIPGHGSYVVATYDPQGSSAGHTFTPVARAEKKTLSWSIDGDRVEITSGTDVLAQSANGNLWVYHDRRYRSQEKPDAVRLQSADTIEWLLPTR